jgi:hypothetical protein
VLVDLVTDEVSAARACGAADERTFGTMFFAPHRGADTRPGESADDRPAGFGILFHRLAPARGPQPEACDQNAGCQ